MFKANGFTLAPTNVRPMALFDAVALVEILAEFWVLVAIAGMALWKITTSQNRRVLLDGNTQTKPLLGCFQLWAIDHNDQLAEDSEESQVDTSSEYERSGARWFRTSLAFVPKFSTIA